MLLFAIPGIASWCASRRGRDERFRGSGTVRVLENTDWVELQVRRRRRRKTINSDRGSWMSVRMLPLGAESHPLSVTLSAKPAEGEGRGGGEEDGEILTAVVSTRSGDWCNALATLKGAVEVEVAGPFAYGYGGSLWTLAGTEDLLLVAGGTGITGWLPGLRRRRTSFRGTDNGTIRCRVVWCVYNITYYPHCVIIPQQLFTVYFFILSHFYHTL